MTPSIASIQEPTRSLSSASRKCMLSAIRAISCSQTNAIGASAAMMTTDGTNEVAMASEMIMHRLGAQSDCAAKNPQLSRKKQIEIACHCLRRTETDNFKPTPTPSNPIIKNTHSTRK